MRERRTALQTADKALSPHAHLSCGVINKHTSQKKNGVAQLPAQHVIYYRKENKQVIESICADKSNIYLNNYCKLNLQ